MQNKSKDQIGVQPRITIDGHDYMLVSEHYSILNVQLASERECRLNWIQSCVELRVQLDAVVDALGECRTKLDWSVTDGEFLDRIDALLAQEIK